MIRRITVKILAVSAMIFALSQTYIYAADALPETGDAELDAIAENIFDGTYTAEPSGIIQKAADLLFGEIKQCGGLSLAFFTAGALTAVIRMQSDGGVEEAAMFAVITLTSGTALKCFYTAMECASGVIEAMCTFITKIAPMIVMLLMSGGNAVAASAFHPVLSAAVYIITLVCQKCILPLITVSAVLSVVNNMSADLRVSNMIRLVNSTVKWILAAVFTMFTGISAIYGFSAPAMDAVGIKTIKFAAGSLVPVVGGFLSDSLETVIAGAKLAKNAVGTAGIIVLVITVAAPVAKLLAMMLIMKLTAAAIEPFGDKRVSGVLWDMSELVTVVLAMVLTVTVMFVVVIAIILSATSG